MNAWRLHGIESGCRLSSPSPVTRLRPPTLFRGVAK